MPCYKHIVVRTKFGEPHLVPCGQCIGCRLERARQWAVRCMHEAQMHEYNSFITLTYNGENLPEDGSLVKRDFQLFMKRLRRVLEPLEVRFYACGEYGEICRTCGLSRPRCSCAKFIPGIGRPHYHAAIFGYDFPDRSLWKITKAGMYIYRSNLLEKVWPLGYSSVGELTFESAGYVARYIMKKITGDMSDDHYDGKHSEFALMSRRPGIAKLWFDKFGLSDVYPKDWFMIRGQRNKPPRYYDYLLESSDPDLFVDVKDKRQEDVEDLDAKRMYEMCKHKKLITKSLVRSMDYE